VASLLLARGSARRREVAVRAALGGSRDRLAQQLFCETMVMALLGGAAGVFLARFAVQAILLAAGGSIPRATSIQVDSGVVLFALAGTFIAALLAGLAPALRLAASAPQTALRDGDRAVTRAAGSRFRAALVTIQVALAVLLVTGAGLLVRSFRSLLSVEAGYHADNVLAAHLALPPSDYPDVTTVNAFFQELRDRLRILPGVAAASAVSSLPLYDQAGNVDFEIEGRPPRAPGEPATSGDLLVAMPDYLEVMGIRLIQGRYFEANDRTDSQPVAVVNQTAARMFWPGQSALGKRIRMAGADSAQWLTIIGVVDDVRQTSLDAPYRPAWHIPLAQIPLSGDFVVRSLAFVTRTNTNPLAVAASVRSTLAALDRSLPLIRLETFDRLRSESVAGPRFTLRLLGTFATVALALSMIGLYGLLSFRVAERLRELGIRRALGAQSTSILGLVMRQGLALTSVGLLLGVAIALPASRVLRELLFQTSTTDPATFVTVAITLFAVAALATLLPAARAVRLDPIRILRSDG
jgi:predicted permease